MKTAVTLLIFILAINFTTPEGRKQITKWRDYVKKFGKFYGDLDIYNERRHKLFKKSLKRVKKWNREYENGLRSYKIGINVLSAMTKKELKDMLNQHAFNKMYVQNATKFGRLYSSSDDDFDDPNVPDALDWREKGVVSPVKYQAKCAGCYAFSVSDTLEAQYAIKTGKLVPLSSQMLIDCTEDRNSGCVSGYMGKTYEFIIENNGLATEADYPFKAKKGKCRKHLTNKTYTLKKYVRLPPGDEEALKRAVAKVGPIAAAIDADPKAFEEYQEGIFEYETCSTEILFHTVVVVGYGTDKKGRDYWIVKNSWSKWWGEGGYMMLARNKDNMCGIATNALFPVI